MCLTVRGVVLPAIFSGSHQVASNYSSIAVMSRHAAVKEAARGRYMCNQMELLADELGTMSSSGPLSPLGHGW